MIYPPKSWKNKDTHYIESINSEWYKSIIILQNELSYATYDFYRQKNMKTFFLPITTNCISSPMGLGSDSKPVSIELFGMNTYLADSMQFMLEYGCRFFHEGCFYLMPSFRGEDVDERHLSQFYHSEAEIVGTLEDIIKLVEEYLIFISRRMLESCKDIICNITGNVNHIERLININTSPRITYQDAVSFLSKKEGTLRTDKNNYIYITNEGEKELLENYNGIVWLTYIDEKIVPFYQASNGNGYAKCADLLLGIGETVGAGERHENAAELIKALSEHLIPEKEYEWYIKLKKYYPLKTAGFGMGTERFLLWLLKKEDIRDCQLIPRSNKNIFIP